MLTIIGFGVCVYIYIYIGVSLFQENTRDLDSYSRSLVSVGYIP